MITQLSAERGVPFILIRGRTLAPWAVEAVGGGVLGFEERSAGGALTLINRDPRIVCDGITDDRCQTA
jgi:hypothetical protein